MGWRYRKRIKILPGIHLNISKSGISTNIGVRGASVTFGSKGTYINTGIPGTGLYRRDKVSMGSQYQYLSDSTNTIPIEETSKIDKKATVHLFKPIYYYLYGLSAISSFVGMSMFCLGYWNMIVCCLIIGFIQILSYSIIYIDYTQTLGIQPTEGKQYVKEEIEAHRNREIQAHYHGRVFSVFIAFSDILPLFSMNRSFMEFVYDELHVFQDISSELVFLFTVPFVFLWLNLSIKEKKQIKLLKVTKATDNLTTTVKNQDEGPHIQETNMNIRNKNTIKNTPNYTTNKNKVIVRPSVIEDSNKKSINELASTKAYFCKDIKNTQKEIVEYGDISIPYDPKRDLENYRYPTLDLLQQYESDGKPFIDMNEQNNCKNRIVDTLRIFGCEISSIKANIGPRITLYEITPALGININRFKGLENDLALAIGSHNVHIIAPLAGKGTIGIEVPNSKHSIVSMWSVLNSKRFQESTMELPCAIGKTITNEVFMFDLAKAPHILIAGSTGQGKSIAINSIITSLLYKKHPAELKLVLMDPKRLELGLYDIIDKHFLASIPDGPAIVTNSSQAVSTLKSICKEMDYRYDLLRMAQTRNIKDYNKKFINRQLNPEIGHKYMPYIVVIIDEYGFFISEKGLEIEDFIVQIAQLARAVGIHMILTTKRPTNDVITGTIKANIPTRIAFRLPERIDSQVILDKEGAEQLLGNGDMLYINGDEPIRVQCAYVDTLETQRITWYISKQQGYQSVFELPDPYYDDYYGEEESHDVDMQHLDPMFEDAARLIVHEQNGSTSLIQRKFAIDYNRAGRLMDQLEKAGIVGAVHGSKPREVLIMDDNSLENLLSQFLI